MESTPPINVGAIGPNPPMEPVDESVTPLASLDLSSLGLPAGSVPLEKRRMRFNRVDVGPNGLVPLHTHHDRPAIIFVAKGEITEYGSKRNTPRTMKAGDISPEQGDVWHWWKAGSEAVVLYSVDLSAEEECSSGC